MRHIKFGDGTRGRNKGSKDSYKRIRSVGKRIKKPEGYKAIKKYLELEKQYDKYKMLRGTLKQGDKGKTFLTSRMKAVRLQQADLYEVIAENYLLDKLSTQLGIGRTMPYRRYLHAKKEGTSWKKK